MVAGDVVDAWRARGFVVLPGGAPAPAVATVAAAIAITWRLLALLRGWHAPVPSN